MSSPSELQTDPGRRPSARSTRRRWRPPLIIAVTVLVIAAAVTTVLYLRRDHQPAPVPLGLHTTATVQLPGDSSRFDYASLDATRGLLFIAHLGASQVIEVDTHTNRVVRVISNIAGVHGVLVVPALHRVYATATDTNQMIVLDEETGATIARGPTGEYPDGLAYDPRHHTIWTTNESGGSETVLDADTATVRATVALGGEAGNVYYDPTSHQMLVDVQTRDQLAVIDPTTDAIVQRIALPGCDHDHGLSIDDTDRLAFVACDGNATLWTIDLSTRRAVDHHSLGQDPDVLAYDPSARRLYVAAESGWLTTLAVHDRRLAVTGSAYLAENAHVVAVDPNTHRSYYPVPHGSNGRPALLVLDPTR